MSATASGTQMVRGVCGHDCPDSCAWQVEAEAGRALRLRGDPAHPFTRGALCAKVNRYLDRVYHPDRVLHPLRRAGPKGEGRFVRVGWDEALADIAARWKAIAAESGAEAILPYSLAGTQGVVQMASLDRRLFGSMGASLLSRSICGEVAAAGLTATQGSGIGLDPEDLVHSRYIVLWGTNTLVTNLHLWPVIAEARRRGARVVAVDPIRTRTAAAADWHLPVRPGSDAALALAMMHVMEREGLVDLDYVERHAEGWEALRARLREHPPERVAPVAGLPATDIERFAREYATTRPSVIRALIGPEHHRNGAMIFRTLACLPLLAGAWRERGGGLCRSTGALQYAALAADRLEMPETARPGLRTLDMRDLGKLLCDPGLSPPIRALCVWNCNPAATVPNQVAIRAGLARQDLFTVVHELFVTDTARYADYLLPATSQLEHLDLVPAWGHHYLALNRPAIAPPGEAVSNTELFRRLATALGRTEPWLFESDEALVRTALSSGHPWLQGISFERLLEEGWARLATPEDFRPYAEGRFPTPSGKARLLAPGLEALGQDPLPSPGEIRSGPGLQLITGKTLHYLNASYGDVEHHRAHEGEITIELCAGDAARRGLADGQTARVFNAGGELLAVCRVSSRVRPGVASMPFGGLRDAAGVRRSVNALTPEEPTDWGGGSGFYDAFVEVEPAGPGPGAPAAPSAS